MRRSGVSSDAVRGAGFIPYARGAHSAPRRVRGSRALAAGGCVLETEIGVVDASLERQLAIIEETFRRHLEERRG